MRINHYISSTGYCSRRKADKLILSGRVTINDQVAHLGQSILESDVVKIDNEIIKAQEEHVYLAYNKPIGLVSTTDLKISDNIIEAINYPKRIFPVGRLDKDSCGLILLTSDGSIVNQILAQENNHEKEYVVRVHQKITPSFLKRMSKGVKIYNPVKNEYTITKQCKLIQLTDTSFKIILTQGLNRQIRRMCSKLGYQVKSLKRIRIMNVHLNDLAENQIRELTTQELTGLLKSNH